MDKLKDKLKTAAIVLASVQDGKVSLIAGVTADSTSKVKAGELVNFVAQQVGGKGGGRPDMAQAGGTDPAALPARWPLSSAGWGSAFNLLNALPGSVYAACVTHAGRCRS
jgi:alanyl-tRNA synthetase